MHPLFLVLLAVLPACILGGSGDVANIYFSASAPYTYNHTTGGGAYNTRTIGIYNDVVQSLEGKQETCGDLVTYILAISMVANPVDADNTLEISMTFTADSTGRSGVALGELVRVMLNGPQAVENGGGRGAGTFGPDTFYLDKNSNAAISGVTSALDGPLYTSGSNLLVNFVLSGLSAGDQIPVRMDLRLLCQRGANPTGNLQASFDSAICSTGRGSGKVSGGAQTIPFKTVADIAGLTECVPTGILLTGVEFNSTVVTSSSSMSNGGASTSSFYYSWKFGSYSGTTSTGIKNLNTFDTKCNYYHQGEYLYSSGPCGGCESTWIDNAQPQLFYDPNGAYYSSATQSATIRGIVCTVYTAVDASKTVQKLYLETATQKIVRAVWADGRVMDFYNVVYGYVPPQVFSPPIVDCTCRRRLDIAVVADESNLIDSNAFTATVTFLKNLVTEYTISPSNTQMALFTYDSAATRALSINNGTSSSNVLTAISSLSCKLVSKKCSSNAPDPAVAINAAVAELKTSSRKDVATPVIILVTSTWLPTTTTIAPSIKAAISAAQAAGISVFTVTYNSGVTPAVLVDTFGSYYLFQRYDYTELQGVDPTDVTAKVCKLNTRPCGTSCCGDCDTACGSCLPVDKCLNNVTNCVNKTIISGSCCTTVSVTTGCPIPTGTCQTGTCNAVTGNCEYSNSCAAPPGDNCYTYACNSGTCSKTMKETSTPCSTVTCTNGQIVKTDVDCGASDQCYLHSCDPTVGCLINPIADSNPSSDLCKIRYCDPSSGWQTRDKDCTSTDLCLPSACVNGSCVITPVVCGNPNDKCDLTKCVGGSCVPGYVDCSKQTPPDPCSVLDTSTFASSGGCNPVTGSCQWKKKVCIPTGCENEVCNSSGLCQKVATAGCGAVGCNCGAGNACYSNRCDTANGNTCYSVAVNCSAYVADTCTTVNPCDNTTGCSYSTKDCSSVTPTDKCHLVVKDPTDPACCTQQPINCQGTNPCKSYSCDPAVGCVVTDLCIPPSDKCVQVTCTTTGCVTTHTDCTPPNACFSGACNSTDGTCSFKTKCDDHDACTTDSCQSGACVNTPMVCDDSNVCTNEQCVNGSCVSTKVVCDDHNPCTVDTCDTVKGCTYTPDNSSCIGDACHTSYCDVKLGCVQNAISCSVATSKCTDTVCLPFQGCVHLAKTCNVTNATACSLSTCDENKGSCHSHVLVCNAGIIDTAAIIGGVVTTATIVGIVIALAAVLGVGGGAYAYYQSSGVMTEPVTQSNPLYVDNKTQGYNPMYKVSQAEI